MGLMVKRGNPLGVGALEDLAKANLRFVNRDPESGTRQLLEQLLAESGIAAGAINGYEQIEFTHAAVAAYVASGMADASFGVEAAARQFGLDFIRIITEDYYFVCREDLLATAPMRTLLDIMRAAEFQDAVATLPGYAAVDTGVVKTIDDAFEGKNRKPPRRKT